MAPPKIKVSRRTPGSIPEGYVLGRVSPGRGDVELLRMPDLARLGVQGRREPGMLAKIPAETILANPGPGELTPTPLTLTAILDWLSTNQGDIIYRNATEWVVLAPGTAGQVLTTGGAAADPAWATASSGSPVVYDDGTVPAGNTVTNDTAETAITSEYTFSANTLLLNDVVRVTLRGVYSTDAAVAPGVGVEFFFGAVSLGGTGSITLATSQTNRGWEAHLLLFVTQAGVSGTAEVQGSAQLNGWQGIVNTAAISIDTTVDNRLRVKLTWSVADADDTITVRQMLVEHMAGANPPPPAAADLSYTVPGDFEAVALSVTEGGLEFTIPGEALTEGPF